MRLYNPNQASKRTTRADWSRFILGNVAAAQSASFAGGLGLPRLARGIFALMRETTAEEGAKTVAPDGCRARDERDTTSLPVLQTRLATALMARSRTVRILASSSPAFRILMAGSSISMFGSRISTVAFPMLVLHLNNSPFITGLVAFAAIAPSALVYVPAGALVDRWNPRRVMLVSELLRGLAIASVVISLAVFGQRTSIWFLILVMVAEEILEIFSMLADRRYLSRLMEHDNMASRQAYIEVRTHAVVLAGRPVGPFLFELQPLLPFLADALSFLFSIGSLLVLRRSDEPMKGMPRLPPRQLLRDVGQGFSWLKKDRRAWLTVMLMAVTSLVAQALILMFLAEAHSKELSTVAIGVVLAASGAGGAIGSIFSKFLSDKVRGYWLPIQMVAWSVALAFLMIAGGLSASWSAVAMFILGFTGAIGNIAFGTYLVDSVGDDMIARVTGIGQMLAIGACSLGPVVGGVALQHYGPQGAIQILLFMVVVVAFLSLFTPEVAGRITLAFRPFRDMFRAIRPGRPASGNVRDEAPKSPGGRRDQKRDGGVLLANAAASARRKIVDHSR
jgi:MFS family permease